MPGQPLRRDVVYNHVLLGPRGRAFRVIDFRRLTLRYADGCDAKQGRRFLQPYGVVLLTMVALASEGGRSRSAGRMTKGHPRRDALSSPAVR